MDVCRGASQTKHGGHERVAPHVASRKRDARGRRIGSDVSAESRREELQLASQDRRRDVLTKVIAACESAGRPADALPEMRSLADYYRAIYNGTSSDGYRVVLEQIVALGG